MAEPNEAGSERTPSAGRRWLVQVSLRRAALAALLLAGLFALLFFVLLPRGGDDSVLAARLLDTPVGATDASVGVRPDHVARDFEASDLDGVRFRLSDLRGRCPIDQRLPVA